MTKLHAKLNAVQLMICISYLIIPDTKCFENKLLFYQDLVIVNKIQSKTLKKCKVRQRSRNTKQIKPLHINLRVNSKRTQWTYWTFNMYNLWPAIWFNLTDKRPDRPEVIFLFLSLAEKGERGEERKKTKKFWNGYVDVWRKRFNDYVIFWFFFCFLSFHSSDS